MAYLHSFLQLPFVVVKSSSLAERSHRSESSLAEALSTSHPITLFTSWITPSHVTRPFRELDERC